MVKMKMSLTKPIKATFKMSPMLKWSVVMGCNTKTNLKRNETMR